MVELTMMTEYGLYDINVHQTMRNLGQICNHKSHNYILDSVPYQRNSILENSIQYSL